MTPKSVTNTILNTAMMTAFGIPGGAPVGIAIALSMGFFDIFCPDAAIPTSLQSATKGDIDNVMTDLHIAISQDFFNSALDAATRTILTDNLGIVETINGMKKQGVDQDNWVFPPDKTSQAWLTGVEGYFTTPSGVLAELRTARDTVTVSSKNDDSLSTPEKIAHRTKTTALYCLATSATLLYLKTAASWEWALETLYTMAYPKWFAQEKAWNLKSPAYQNLHPEENPANLFPSDVPKLSAGLLDWQDWVAKRATAVDLMQDEMDAMVSYAIHDATSGEDGLFTLMNKNWIARTSQFDAAMTNAVQYSAGTNTPQIVSQSSNAANTQNSIIGAACASCVDYQNEVLRGAAGLAQWEADTDRYGFDGVSADDLALFHETIGIWQDAFQTLQFQTLTAKAGATPGSLAQSYYGDDTLWNTLLDCSERPFAAKTQDLNGVRVKLLYREAQIVKLPGLDMKRADLPALPGRLV